MAPKAAVLLSLLSLLLPFSSLALTQDFCVANLGMSDTPAGYPCKPKLAVTSDDFYYRGLAQPGLLVAPFNTSLATATVKQFPGLNGLGLAATRVDIRPGGVVPLHSHPEASELLFVFKGNLSAGFISAETNKVYVKVVREGELFVFPRGLLHFQYNIGNETAVAFAAYSNPNPGLQITDFALFGSTLTPDVVNKITFISKELVNKTIDQLFFALKLFLGPSE